MRTLPGRDMINWMLLVLYLTAIYVQSSYPSVGMLQEVRFGDKLLHVAGYALLGILFFRAFRSIHGGNRLIAWSLLSISASTAYGVSDEIHQYFVPCRSADIWDVFADMAGSVAGVTAYVLLIEKYDFFGRYSWIDKLRQSL